MAANDNKKPLYLTLLQYIDMTESFSDCAIKAMFPDARIVVYD